jgi:tRNA 2-selenouridine synthase SelU
MTPDLASRLDELEIRIVEMRALLVDVLSCAEAQKQAHAAQLRFPSMTADEYLDFFENARTQHYSALQKLTGELLCNAAKEQRTARIEKLN